MFSKTALAIVLIALPAVAFASPIKPDAVVPETELSEVQSVCSFSLCPSETPGAGKQCMPKPEDCKNYDRKTWCTMARCSDESAEDHAGSAAFTAGIQSQCWTAHSTGAECYFDKSRTDCAVCVAGGCQCWLGSPAGHNRCAKCEGPVGGSHSFIAPQGCKSQVALQPEKCPPEAPYGFEAHTGKSCRSHDADLKVISPNGGYFEKTFRGTVEGCQAKCIEHKCSGFTFTKDDLNKDAQGSQPSGVCIFRQGPLQPFVDSDGTDCYVPNLPKLHPKGDHPSTK